MYEHKAAVVKDVQNSEWILFALAVYKQHGVALPPSGKNSGTIYYPYAFQQQLCNVDAKKAAQGVSSIHNLI